MATVKYDVRGVDPGQDFDEPIPKGVYRVKILSCILTKSSKGNQMLELELEVVKGDHKGRRLWDYITLTEKSRWKLSGLVHALGLKERGSLNPASLVGKSLTVKVKHETYETEDDDGNTVTKLTSKVGSMIPVKDEPAEDEEDEEEEEYEDEEDEEEGDEEESDEEEDEGEEEELTYEDVQEASKAELKEIIAENELGIRITKKSKLAALRDKVSEALELEPEEEEGDEEDEEEESGYEDMSLKELKDTLRERGLSPSGKKDALIERLETDDEEEGEGEDEPF